MDRTFTWKLNIISVIALRETNFDKIQLDRSFLGDRRVTSSNPSITNSTFTKSGADRFEFRVLFHFGAYGKII